MDEFERKYLLFIDKILKVINCSIEKDNNVISKKYIASLEEIANNNLEKLKKVSVASQWKLVMEWKDSKNN